MSRVEAEKLLRIGALAARSGVSTDTLRHYERRGLLPQIRRSPGGYRLYGPEAVRRVAIIRAGLAVGLSLAEIADVLRMRDAGGAPCGRVRGLVEQKLRDVETRLRAFERERERLREMLATWDVRLAGTAAGERAGLLEALATGAQGDDQGRHPLHAPVPRRETGVRGRGVGKR